MAVERQTRAIGEWSFEMGKLTAFDGLKAFHRLTTIGGPAIPAIMKAVSAGDDNEVAKMLLGALPSVLARATPDEVVDLSKSLLKDCLVTVAGKQTQVLSVADLLFQGYLLELLQLIAFAVEVNFAGFFTGLKKLGGDRKIAAASQSNSATG